MGPRFIDRGKILPLPPAAQLGLLQWGRGSSTAERRFASDRSTSRTHRFNGAAVHRPRKERSNRSRHQRPVASMGPRFIDRGKSGQTAVGTNGQWLQWGRGSSTAERFGPSSRERLHEPRFNGAAVHRPRKGGSILLAGTAWVSFNGAAVHRPRKDYRVSAVPSGSSKLQWGRGSSTAERWSALNGGRCDNDFASMGPRFIDRGKPVRHDRPSLGLVRLQWGRGSSTAERLAGEEACANYKSFNGAAVHRPRKAGSKSSPY